MQQDITTLSQDDESLVRGLKPRKAPSDGVPIEFMDDAIIVVSDEVARQAGILHPGLPVVTKMFFPDLTKTDPKEHAKEVEKAHLFGFYNMAGVAVIQQGFVDNHVHLLVLQSVERSNALFVTEKYSDDLAYFDEALGEFRYPEHIKQFDSIMYELLDPNLPEERFAEVVCRFVHEIDTTTVSTETRHLIQGEFARIKEKDPKKSAMLAHILPEYFVENPERWLLGMNAYAGALLYRDILHILDDNPELQPLVEHGFNAGYQRYRAMDYILENHDMPIEEAVMWGKWSILTDVFSGHLAATAQAARQAGNMQLYEEIAQNQDLIIEGMDRHSLLIRLLNDAGASMFNVDESIKEIEKMRAEYDPEGNMAPRELFRRLDKEYHRSERAVSSALSSMFMPGDAEYEVFKKKGLAGINLEQLYARYQVQLGADHPLVDLLRDHIVLRQRRFRHSRPTKDAVEHEYNMLLNSGMQKGMTIDEQYEMYYSNLGYVSTLFHEKNPKFLRTLGRLKDRSPFAYNYQGRFVLFNEELYVRDYDYDRVVDWSSLECMTVREIPFEERLAKAA